MALAYSPRSGGTRGAACANWIIPDLLPLPSTQAPSLERRSRLRISSKGSFEKRAEFRLLSAPRRGWREVASPSPPQGSSWPGPGLRATDRTTGLAKPELARGRTGASETRFRLGVRSSTRIGYGRSVATPPGHPGAPTPALVRPCPRFDLQPHRSVKTTCGVDSQFGSSARHTSFPAYSQARRHLAARLLGWPWYASGLGRGGSIHLTSGRSRAAGGIRVGGE